MDEEIQTILIDLKRGIGGQRRVSSKIKSEFENSKSFEKMYFGTNKSKTALKALKNKSLNCSKHVAEPFIDAELNSSFSQIRGKRVEKTLSTYYCNTLTSLRERSCNKTLKNRIRVSQSPWNTTRSAVNKTPNLQAKVYQSKPLVPIKNKKSIKKDFINQFHKNNINKEIFKTKKKQTRRNRRGKTAEVGVHIKKEYSSLNTTNGLIIKRKQRQSKRPKPRLPSTNKSRRVKSVISNKSPSRHSDSDKTKNISQVLLSC